jgi:hypothetical protein
MTAWAWVLVGLAATFGLAALGDLISEEIRGWLDLAPRALLRLAATQLDPAQRVTIYHDEWLPELCYVLRGAESRPITRLIRGTNFATGLLISARRIARRITRTPRPHEAVWARQSLISTAQARLSFAGGDIDVTGELEDMAVVHGMSVKELISKLDFVGGLSDTVQAKLPVGEPIQFTYEQIFSPDTSGAGHPVISRSSRPERRAGGTWVSRGEVPPGSAAGITLPSQTRGDL